MDRSRNALHMLARVCNMAVLALHGFHLHAVLQDVALLTSQPQQAARTQLCFEGVEERTASFDPAVTAADLWRLCSLLQLHSAHQLIKQGPQGQMLSQLEGTALGAVRQLRRMSAGRDAAFLHRRASDVLSGAHKLQEALPEQRAALRLATADKGEAAACTVCWGMVHSVWDADLSRLPANPLGSAPYAYVRATNSPSPPSSPKPHTPSPLAPLCAAHASIIASCLSLTTLLMSGAAGPRFSRQEVQDLLAQSQRARRLCKGWIPNQAAKAYKQSLRGQEESLAEAVSLQPGSDLLNAWDDGREPLAETPVPHCWGCGRQSTSLRTCSLCHTAAYCRCGLRACWQALPAQLLPVGTALC